MIQFVLPHNSNIVKESRGEPALRKIERWLVIDREQGKQACFEMGSVLAPGLPAHALSSFCPRLVSHTLPTFLAYRSSLLNLRSISIHVVVTNGSLT